MCNSLLQSRLATMRKNKAAPANALSNFQLLPFAVLSPFLRFLRKRGQSRRFTSWFARTMNSPRFKRRAFRGYYPDSRDVIVATFGKSGTNWAMQIALQIAHLGDAEFDFIHDLIPWPDAPLPIIRAKLKDSSLAANSPTGLRVIKTHWEQDFVPYNAKAMYIVIIRDPKEVFVSGYYFAQSVFGAVIDFDYSSAEWFEIFLSERYAFGSWAAHTASWWALREKKNVFLTSFTEMKRASEAKIRQIAELMKVELSEKEMSQVIEKSSFAYMKAIEERFAPPLGALFGNDDCSVTMMRKGEAGASDELLDAAQKAQIDEFSQQELARLGSDFPYLDYF